MTSPWSDPGYLVPPLVAMAVTIILMLMVALKARRSLSTWLFFGLLLNVALWNFLTFGMRSSADVSQAVLWSRAHLVIGFAIYLIYYHFTQIYCDMKWQKPLVFIAYALLLTVIILAPTDLLVKEMRLESYGYAPVLSAWSLLASASGIPFLGLAIYNLVKRYRVSWSYEEKNRMIYLVLAPLFPIMGSILDGYTNLPPALIWGNMLFCIVCSIAFLKYHLLDVRFVARKSLAYLFTSLGVAVPYAGAILLANEFLGEQELPWWGHALLILLLAVLLHPLYSLAQRWADRLFYRDRYDYLKALETFSQQTQSITRLDELATRMVRLVRGALKSTSVCLLVRSENQRGLVLSASAGMDMPPSPVVLRDGNSLVKWLESHREILYAEQLQVIPQLQSLSSREKGALKQMQARIIVPMLTRQERLAGVLVLGEKLSQLPYSGDDIMVLVAVSSHMAMALENARFYEETRRSEMVLRESEERLRLVYESMAEGLIVTDLNLTILEVNDAALGMYGGSGRDELIGGSILRLFPERERESGQEVLESVLNSSVIRPLNCNLCRRDGTEFPTELSLTAIEDTYGNPTGVVVIMEDVTERKKAEAERRELEQKAQIASRLASVGEMASGIAHEINNPLTGVIGFTKLLMSEDISPPMRQRVELIHDSAERVANIVRRLLAFARQQKPERAEVNINEIIEASLSLRAYAHKTGNIRVTTRLEPGLPPTVADSVQLQQVFLNIIINAETEMRLAHGRGQLEIITETVGDYIQISFTDDGPGIAEENLKRIFDPFFTTRKVGEGTGLGLSICHGIIAEHNGQIRVESELGKGARFIVRVPVVSGTATPGVEEAGVAEAPVAGKGRILVVDDELVVRELLYRVLRDEGYEVVAVADADAALFQVRREPYDLILLDIKLPGTDGIDLYQRLQNEPEPLAGKVVFITGDVMAADTREFLEETMSPCFTKPFDIEQIKRDVSEMLINSR